MTSRRQRYERANQELQEEIKSLNLLKVHYAMLCLGSCSTFGAGSLCAPFFSHAWVLHVFVFFVFSSADKVLKRLHSTAQPLRTPLPPYDALPLV